MTVLCCVLTFFCSTCMTIFTPFRLFLIYFRDVQEKRVGEYQKAGVTGDAADNHFSLDADF
jgi:hypothetical protein